MTASHRSSGRNTNRVRREEVVMPDKTYKIIEVVGVSEDSIQQAVRNALKKASQTIRNIDWFEVKEIRGALMKSGAPQFQVEVRIGFRLEGDRAD
jgi:flavin-binding protein dodecin